MTMKVSELAKELEMTSKELIEKAGVMGIVVKAAGSSLTEIDAKTLRNNILAKRKKGAETRIVRANPQQSGIDKRQEPKVTVRVAKVQPPTTPTKSRTTKATSVAKGEEQVKTSRLPIGKPMTKAASTKSVVGKPSTPGKPIPKADTTKPAIMPGTPVAKAETTVNEAEAQIKHDVAEGKNIEMVKKTGIKETLQVRPKAEKKVEQKTVDSNYVDPKKETHKKEDSKAVEAKKTSGAAKKASKPKVSGKKESAPRRNSGNNENVRKVDSRKKPGEGDEKKRGEIQGAGAKRSNDRRGTSVKDKDKQGKQGKQGKNDKNVKREPRSLEKKTRKKFVKPKIAVPVREEAAPLPLGTKIINVPITIAGFCEQTGVSIANVILTLLKMGIVANQNQNIDEITVATLADEMGIQVVIGKVDQEEVEEGLELFEDREKDLQPRSPIITVMGHVDHGKTSLLDAIRKTDVTAGESGGITQHIGASEVEINGEKIVFLDTPGHEAFTAMRARGADITDIAVLVVAADDSVKPQTIESISHAKAAGVPIIVAVNKIDKPGANPDKVKQDLTEHGIVVEEYGGDVISVPVSAKSGEGIVNLLEMILIQAEVLELKANPNRHAMGTVIEARLDKAKGPVASLLVTNGTLKTGQSIVAGTSAGRIRLMTNHKGDVIRKAGSATAVEVLGLTDVPAAGDKFNAVGDDKLAKEIAEKRKLKQREEVMAKTSGSSLEELFNQMEEGEVKELNLIIKADVGGSIGAIIGSLEKLSNNKVKVRVIHSGVGAVTESDVALAGTSGAIIIGFNVRPGSVVAGMAEREGVQIRTYRVIYNIIDDIEAAMKGMLDPEFREEVLGQVEVRETFKVPGVGIIAGAYVTSGKVLRNAQARLVREGIVIYEGTLSSLRRFKDDAKEVAQGYECGIGIANYNDIKVGDVIECFHMVEIERD